MFPATQPNHAFALALLDAQAPRQVAQCLVAHCLAQGGCKNARFAWETPGVDGTAQGVEPPGALDEQAVGQWHALQSQPMLVEANGKLAIALDAQATMVLWVELEPGTDPEAFHRLIASDLVLAERVFGRTLAWRQTAAALSQLEHSEKVQRALFDISELAGSPLEMNEMLAGVHAIVAKLMYAENFFIVLYRAETDTIRFLYFSDTEDETPWAPDVEMPLAEREKSLTWYILRDGKPLMGTTEQLRQQVSGELAIYGADSGDFLGVPMLNENAVEGVLVVQSYEGGTVYTQEDKTLLQFVASHILTALERKQHKAELERKVIERTSALRQEVQERMRAERLQGALFQIAQLANEDMDEAEFYRRVHEIIGQLIDARNFFIAMLSEDRASLDFPYYVDAHKRHQERRPAGGTMTDYVLRMGQPLIATGPDIMALVNAGVVDQRAANPLAECWIGVPLFIGDQTIGAVCVQSYEKSLAYGAGDRDLLSFVASQVANSLNRRRAALIQREAFAQLEQRVNERTSELRHEINERERAQEQLRHQVMHDPLTGLPNRSSLRERLDHALSLTRREPEREFALLYLDIDRFKVINDSLGHLAGDSVLVEVAKRLQTCIRDPDLPARLSGDEFAILLENVSGSTAAARVAQRIIDILSQPFSVGKVTMEPSVSIGIAIADARYTQADEVLRDADLALYRAKQSGRKRFELFDEAPQRQAVDVLALEMAIKNGIGQDQFEPYFQPIVDLANKKVVGHEALVRWQHPDRGTLGPYDFMRVAEESGSMEHIDWRIFRLSCERIQTLADKTTFLTINVSPKHFRNSNFHDRMEALLVDVNIDPRRVLTEITEGSLLQDPDQVRATLNSLRTLGVHAALDDFGTGYSSLSYLHSFPLRLLKIDKSFVAALDTVGENNSNMVVAAIIAMAHAMGMKVVAEGIETQAQMETLTRMGCDMGQGYYLGRPHPISHWKSQDTQ